MAAETLQRVGTFTIAADDPCLQGHFPGHPIVPGVVILDHALTLLTGTLADAAAVAALPRLKFTGVVEPGECVVVSGTRQGSRLAFRCHVGERPVAEGQAEIAG